MFVFLALDLGLTLARAPRAERWAPLALLAFGLGFVGGFGLWFNFQFALPLALIAATLAVARSREVFGRGGRPASRALRSARCRSV